MAQSLASLALPAPPSWYPGHMRQFVRTLPALLSRTDVVLELRDARLPLTSINGTFEGVLQKWRHERRRLADAFVASGTSPTSSAAGPSLKGHSSLVTERIVVMNKRDLVAEWGIEPFRRAMETRFPDQRVIFASWNRPRDVKNLHEMIVNIAREHAHISNELNVLVVGMPNVGKSTLLNALRNMGIPGPTAKALRTSAHPGLTRALSTRLKLSQDPLVYSFDSPGVMLPFLGKGDLGAERGIKLALIAGIRTGLYSEETLAQYLLYRLNLLNPHAPAYLSILPPGSEPTDDVHIFLDSLARRLSMLKRGGERDIERAAAWFVKWWREGGCAISADAQFWNYEEPPEPQISAQSGPEQTGYAPDALLRTGPIVGASGKQRGGWGFDFQWEMDPSDVATARADSTGSEAQKLIQREMERVFDEYIVSEREERESTDSVSTTQQKKLVKEEKRAKREKRIQKLLAERRAGKR